MPGADVYRHLRLRAWSVREGGRVVAHERCVLLTDCTLVASEASRRRLLAQGRREVHAWVRGTVTAWSEPPATARVVRYRPLLQGGFRDEDGEIVVSAEAVWLCADGSAYACGMRGREQS